MREALLALPHLVLMPQAYVRRSAPDETPPRWDLLDWARRDELLERLHSGDSGTAGQRDSGTVSRSSMMASRSSAVLPGHATAAS
ncbi:hypothetical protein AB0N81_31600 [Streptomyces sp. NPDC093510]|uniref:hypothetical protein n=1 Tax=Streptomyces sp. NPDC093510 TaxID=3155199 RepID=UPI00341F7C29